MLHTHSSLPPTHNLSWAGVWNHCLSCSLDASIKYVFCLYRHSLITDSTISIRLPIEKLLLSHFAEITSGLKKKKVCPVIWRFSNMPSELDKNKFQRPDTSCFVCWMCPFIFLSMFLYIFLPPSKKSILLSHHATDRLHGKQK